MKASSPRLLLTIAFIAAQSASASDVTWTASSYGNWSDGTKWSTTPNAPANDGTDKAVFLPVNQTFLTGVDSSSWAVNGLVLGNVLSSGTGTITLVAGPLSGTGTAQTNQSATLSLGAGGITVNTYSETFASSRNLILNLGSITIATNVLTLNVTADQTWKSASQVAGTSSGNAGTININANLTGNSVITIRGNDVDTPVTGDPNRSAGTIKFASGNSTGFTGSFVLQSGVLALTGTSQLDRLGSNALVVRNSNAEHTANNSTLNFENMNSATQEFKNDVVFQDTGATPITFGISGSTAPAGSKFIYSGDWSGALNDNLTLSSANKNLLVSLQGDNSGLTSSKTVVAGDSSGRQTGSIFYLKQGYFLVENANTFGTANSLSISLGFGGSTPTLATAGLWTKNGIDIKSLIYVDTSTTKSPILSLGLMGEGNASFTGAITMRDAPVAEKVASLRLTAATGGTATFSGNILDQAVSNNTASTPVIIEGGGTVILSGTASTYKGSTTISQGTTFLANGGSSTNSATGLGNVRVGYDQVAVTGTTTLNSSVVTVVSKTGLALGQSITGAGIPTGAFITFISGSTNSIEISENATVSGTTGLAGAAETGILGGTGKITPGVAFTVAQSITVANGSSIAPGEMNSIGTLTLDGKNTTANLLTMNVGATFTFNLGLADTSDQLAFWNFVDNDFVLNDNVINFVGAQEGAYTLFTFYANSGLTATASGISSGLVVGTGLEGYTYSLNYNTDSITLNVQAVPEPSTWAMLVGGMGLLAFGQQLRRRSA